MDALPAEQPRLRVGKREEENVGGGLGCGQGDLVSGRVVGRGCGKDRKSWSTVWSASQMGCLGIPVPEMRGSKGFAIGKQ